MFSLSTSNIGIGCVTSIYDGCEIFRKKKDTCIIYGNNFDCDTVRVVIREIFVLG